MRCGGRKLDRRDTETQRGLVASAGSALSILETFARVCRSNAMVLYSPAAFPHAQDEERVAGRAPLCLCVSVVVLSLAPFMGPVRLRI